MSFDIMIRLCCFLVPEISIPIDIRKRFSYQGTKNFSPNVISPESFDGSHFYLTYVLCRVRMSSVRGSPEVILKERSLYYFMKPTGVFGPL